jgi:hypothetical protein
MVLSALGLLLAASALSTASNLPSLSLSGPPTLPLTASGPNALNPSLASFSIETAFFTTFFGNLSAPNTLSTSLLSNIVSRTGGVPPEIRIGGITSDSTYWRPGQTDAEVNFIDGTGALINTTIGPEFWNVVNGVLPNGTKVIFNLVSIPRTIYLTV